MAGQAHADLDLSLIPQNPRKDGRRKQIPQSCSLTSTAAHMPTHTLVHMIIIVLKDNLKALLLWIKMF